MNRTRTVRLIAAVLALIFIAAACGDSDGSGVSQDTAATSTEAGSQDTAAPSDEGVSLVGICPNPLVIQTDWFPQPEHGFTYNLIGVDGVVDAENGTYTGPLGDTGIDLEIRAGGPYIGFSPPSAQFYSDDSIFMAYVDTATAVRDSGTLPVVAVYSPFEKSPQVLMWGEDTFSFESFQEIGDAGVPVLYFEGSAYMDYLLGQGFLSADQIDGSYDGGPSRFVTEDVVQQGYATNEVYRYENDFEDYLRPVSFMLVHDAGFENYDSLLSVKPEQITEDAACLEALVPLVQQSHADFMANPEAVNKRLDEIVKELDSFWTSSVELHAYSVATMRELGLVGNGDNDYLGDMDGPRIQGLIDIQIPILEGLGLDSMKEGLLAEDIFTNEFLDTSIGFGF